MSTYKYTVEALAAGPDAARTYDGTNATEALAAWRRAITGGADYVNLEAVRLPEEDPKLPVDVPVTGGRL